MTIYGKNTYVTKRNKKHKARPINESGVTGKQVVEDVFRKIYGIARKHKCQKCGELVFMIKGKAHELEAGVAGCHEPHRCK